MPLLEVPEFPELTPAIVAWLIERPEATILEIGANDGEDTERFIEAFPRGRIWAFECDRRAAEKWRKRIGDDPLATLEEIAVSDHVGEAVFYPSCGVTPEPEKYGVEPWDKSGSLLVPTTPEEHHQKWLEFLPPITVPTTTLDAWDEAHGDGGAIDFAWVDVQGAEAAVLRGAQNVLRRIRWWYCECHRLPYYYSQATLEEICELLPSFALCSRHGDNFLFRNESL
jgi:FkbM family methyltransferase